MIQKTYKCNDVLISVEDIEGFGKNPGLWIGTKDPNQLVKVASFGNEDKAMLFCKWFEYFVGLASREAVKWDEGQT